MVGRPRGSTCSAAAARLRNAALGFAWLQVVDAETQKAMMAFYYKKQEEQKVGADRSMRHVGRLHA